MNRRQIMTLLGASAISLSGCTAVGTITNSNDNVRTVTVKSTDEVPSKYDINITVEMTEKSVTSNHTAQLQVTIENRSNEQVRIGDGHNRVFSSVVSQESEPGFLLIPPDQNVTKRPGCWQPVIAPDVPAPFGYATLGAGESESITYDVWSQGDNSPTNCYPVGDFTFKTTYHIFNNSNKEKFDWNFTLSVK